jgi:hypothetical protein
MRHGSLMWIADKTGVDICAPSIRTAVATFLFGGPLLCGPVWIFMSWGIADTPGGMLYETTWRISEYIGAIPMPTSPKFFARGGGAPIVTVIGFILGAYLTWQATRVNTAEPSNN